MRLRARSGKKEKDLSEDEYLRINTAGWDGIVDSYRNFTRDYWDLAGGFHLRPQADLQLRQLFKRTYRHLDGIRDTNS